MSPMKETIEMTLLENPTRRALVIGAHPDDNEVGCGGTTAKLIQAGWDITFLICTNGNKGSNDPKMSSYLLAELREIEQQVAANVLGVQTVVFLRHNDGELAPSPSLRFELALYIRHFKPHAIYTHDPWRIYMMHPDHRAVGFAVIEAIVHARDPLFLPGLGQIGVPAWRPGALYLWWAEHPDHVEDVSSTLAQKVTALRAHASQEIASPGWVERVAQKAVEIGAEKGMVAGEAFKKIPL